MIKCSECPRCKPTGRTDRNGYPFCICGMSGNIVYQVPRKEKRYNGNGYIHFSESSCGIYDTFEKAFNAMTKTEQARWTNSHFESKQLSFEDFIKESK